MAAAGKAGKLTDDEKGLVLSSGGTMPTVGLGCWKIGREVAADAAYAAIQNGYRCLDGACDYGNEKEIGEGLHRAMKEGIVKREDVFVTSKLWNTYHHKEHVRAACKKSLSDMNLDYFDLYLIHFPISLKFVPFETRYPPEWFHDPTASNPRMIEDPVPLRETWEAMEALVDEGLVKRIGVSNMGTAMIRDLLSYARIRPSALQVEMHPYLPQQNLLRYCQEQGIAVTAYSNLGAGSYVELGGATMEESCLENDVVINIGKAHGRTPAQIVLRWAVQRGTAVIPKTTKAERLVQNASLFDFALTKEEMTAINHLDRKRRFNDSAVYTDVVFNCYCPIFD
mmetsp:Transcript_14637/g.41587  ORF Transcript_14637/g.41587 Transcript_14637/m.41587 type:complete len:339 (+) Transcript_14637:152-1168(+)|eukprot:CAMPEP_0119133162 /NCGR_PEP_ID=MMETSP1310-20130426/13162_1 /TAXON_ID=464262 /ORGANISM="Genus nov. species nov., Strain RCC2339" /LENGTH=338 /DNA_ID=CAMNT_0007123843 /DNA_START=60 /DNA_END=1076 /DNA_ORIENTATION=-